MTFQAGLRPLTKVVLCTVIALLLMFCATAVYADTVQITGATVNVRSGPGSTYEKVGSVSSGGQYELVVKGNGWYKIALGNGKYGWVSAEYSAIINTGSTGGNGSGTSANTVPADYSNYKQGTVNTTSLNLREGPGTSYASVTKLASGTGVSIYSASGEWYKIVTSSGQSGWVSSSYITLKNTKLSSVAMSGSTTQPPNTNPNGGSLSGKVIYIDPGHGDYSTSGSGEIDKGSSGFGLYESDVTWAISQKVFNKLYALGAEVHLTRSETPANQDLYDRAGQANDANADLFISIHTNSFTSETANGTSTWIYAPKGDDRYDRETRLLLANSIQNALVAATGLSNYGVREANFAVTRETNMPSALVETAFISNASDNAYLASAEGKEALAQGIVNGIVNFFNQYTGATGTTADAADMMVADFIL